MKFQRLFTLLIAVSATTPLLAASSKRPVDYVNPMIGALTTTRQDACGKTFPGPATPFGLVQLGPDTVSGGDNGSGYSADMKTIEGFSFLHMSGVGWYGDFGNLQVMPETGDLIIDRDQAKSPFEKSSEVARAAYYSVMLDRYRVKAELTAQPHAGIIRFTYPQSSTSRIKIDLTRRIGGNGSHSSSQYVRQVDDRTFEGWMKCDSSGGGWGNGAGHVSYTVYFSLQTNVPIQRVGVWDGQDVRYGLKEYSGSRSGFFLEFPTRQNQQVLVKSGISFVSIEGARNNLAAEIPGWNFDAVYRSARSLWTNALDAVDVSGGSDLQKTIFYTALYHAFLDPRSVADVDGSYIAPDGQARKREAFTARTCFSGWDVFRAEFPLLTLVEPSVINDEINSLMQIDAIGPTKGLPRWELMGRETGCMIGDPAISVICDAYQKGLRGFDAAKAYEMCWQVARGPASKSNRHDLSHWLSLGYCTERPGISNTLENAYADYAAGRLAEKLGRIDDARSLYASAMNYRNVFDPSVGWFRLRDETGAWLPWSGRLKSGGCVESNPEQQGWFVPQDVAGLIKLVGGADAFNTQLNELFENTSPAQIKGWNDWYNHSNEPVHQCAFLFAYSQAPWLTQKWSRFICENAYGDGPSGICGNDDVGQMSAWYVLAAAGFYPASPASNVYVIGSPVFDKAVVRLAVGAKRPFTIVAHNNSPSNIYIQSATLNGKPLNRSWIAYPEIENGAELVLEMGPAPNKSWGSAADQAPPSLSTDGAGAAGRLTSFP